MVFSRNAFPLAQLIPVWGPVSWLGKNTLVFMCLDGLLHDFVNPGLAGWLAPAVPDSPLAVFLTSTAVTLLSLAACAPVVVLLNRYVPQLVGRRVSQRMSLS
jgi:fucose 4-O-acetylase-like acetyltransferase